MKSYNPKGPKIFLEHVQFVKTLEDENHFLIFCQINNVLRIKLFNDMAIDNPMFPNLSDTEKLVVLLNPSNINQVKKTGSFIKQSLELRTGDS